jgi:putative DNA primase/helicase
MTVADIAANLGGAYRSGAWWRCRCLVHDSRGATLAMKDSDRGLIVNCFAGCQPRDILGELRRRGLLAGTADGARSAQHIPKHRRDDDAARIAMAQRMWDAAKRAPGTPVVAYLANRGITLPVPSSVRWEPRCWHRDAQAELPAMIAAVRDADGRFIGSHRTYLERDEGGSWRRRDRASLGPICGGAVPLGTAARTLMVGEGIETCLAAMTATAMPAWAALSTSGLVVLALPPIVRQVIVLVDHDRSGAGERAARKAAARWLAEGRLVKLAIPPEPGTDFNDLLLGHTHAPIAEAGDVAA